MRWLLFILPLCLNAQERRLSVNWVTGIAGGYAHGGYLEQPTKQTSWRMVNNHNGTDSMFGWDNWGVDGEYSYCRTDFHKNQDYYWLVTFDYYVNNNNGCSYGQAVENIQTTTDSGRTWINQWLNLTPDTGYHYQSKSGNYESCICALEMNCWYNNTKWHHFTFVFWGGEWTAIRFTFDYHDYHGKGRNYNVPLTGFWIRDFNMQRLDTSYRGDNGDVMLGFKPKFKQQPQQIEFKPPYFDESGRLIYEGVTKVFDLIGRETIADKPGIYIIQYDNKFIKLQK